MQINREALKAIRTRSGMPIAELARRTGIDRTAISRIESGDRRGTVDQLGRLAGALGVPPYAITLYESDEVAA